MIKVALYSQKKDLDTFLYLSKFVTELERRNVKPILFSGMADSMEFSKDFERFSNKEELRQFDVDFLFTFGGDGTLVNSILFVHDLEIPIVGVNMGRLGFLASFTKDELFNEIDNILNEDTHLSKRSLIEIVSPNSGLFFPYALNDVSISRK